MNSYMCPICLEQLRIFFTNKQCFNVCCWVYQNSVMFDLNEHPRATLACPLIEQDSIDYTRQCLVSNAFYILLHSL